MTGSLLAMWCNALTYKATQGGVSAASRIDPTVFFAALAQAQQNGTIAGPVPTLQFTYDATTQVQTIACSAVLTDAMRVQLAALIAAPPATATLLGNLLQQVRNQAVAQFQLLATGLLAPALADPDPFVKPFIGAAAAQQQKFAKAELVKVFLPLRVQKLSRQLVLQTLGASLAANASLLEALVTDAALLNDPSSPGRSLLQTFLAAGRQGVSASYFDANSALLASGIAATTDTADATNSVAGAVSSHFEGYLQVPTDGPYRFFAQLGNVGVQVAFHIDAPSSTALFANPIVEATAAANGDEASQFVQLKAGVAYHFTLDFLNVGAAGAKLLIQGETLPKGALSQIVLYPEETVDAFARAQVVLGKVLQILAVTGLDQRELSYVVSNATQFNNLQLSALPTQASDDSPAKAAALFSQFLSLADYADLRKGPAGGTDGLVDVFQAASTASGVSAAYYPTVDEIGAPHASGIAATIDTVDPTNSVPGTASCRFEGYLVAPADGSYDFFAELGKAGAKVTFRVDAPRGTTPLANSVVLQHTAAADGEEAHQAVTLTSGVAYHVTLDFQALNGGAASLLVQTASLSKGPLNRLVLYPVSQLPPWIVLANLTRRDPQVVRDVADALGPSPHFSNNVGIRRMWDALQLVQILGLPVQALSASTAIATPAPTSPDAIAADFKNAVKAQYTADQWRPIAQSVFDPLRQKKRDALVSHLVNTLGLDTSNQLFEYFLVDPGMEPVVQTSRLRLALSSIQTFVQRCFLNLENGNTNAALNVAASAIPADWRPWMKR
jgi:ABC toxin N-terminal region